MGIFSELQKRNDIALLVEEKLYEYVAQEISEGNIRQGLWAKATAQSDSTETVGIQKTYIKLRVEMLKTEDRVQQRFSEEILDVQEEEPPTVAQVLELESDNPFVNAVKNEIKLGSVHTALWVKAKNETGSTNQAKITSTYIDLRATYLAEKKQIEK